MDDARQRAFTYSDRTLRSGALAKYFNNPTFSDVRVVAPDGRKLFVHQVLLSSSSQRFADMLEQGNLAGEEVRVDGVGSDELEAVIRFFYTGELSMTYRTVVPLMDTAQRLEVPGVPAACKSFLAQVLAPSTAVALLSSALACNVADLEDPCCSVIAHSFAEVAASEDFRSAGPAVMMRLLAACRSRVDEVVLFKAAWAWVCAHVDHVPHLEDIMALIKIPPISIAELLGVDGGGGGGGKAGGEWTAPGGGGGGADGGGRADGGGDGCAPASRLPSSSAPRHLQLAGPLPSRGSSNVSTGPMYAQQAPRAAGAPPPPALLPMVVHSSLPAAQLLQQAMTLGGLTSPGGLSAMLAATLAGARPESVLGPAPLAPSLAPGALAPPPTAAAALPGLASSGASGKLPDAAAVALDAATLASVGSGDAAGSSQPPTHDLLAALSQQLLGAGGAGAAAAAAAAAAAEAAAVAGGAGRASALTSSGSGGSMAVVGEGSRGSKGTRPLERAGSLGRPLPSADTTATNNTTGLQEVAVPLTGGPRAIGRASSTAAVNRNSFAKGICQVDGCYADLQGLRDYHLRYKICEYHLKVSSVMREGRPQRFCQQCGRFHGVEEFDGNKRSCRSRLKRHNARRRKMAQDDETASGPASKRGRGGRESTPPAPQLSNGVGAGGTALALPSFSAPQLLRMAREGLTAGGNSRGANSDDDGGAAGGGGSGGVSGNGTNSSASVGAVPAPTAATPWALDMLAFVSSEHLVAEGSGVVSEVTKVEGGVGAGGVPASTPLAA